MKFDSLERQPIGAFYVPIIKMGLVLVIISFFVAFAAQDFNQLIASVVSLGIVIELPYAIYRWLRYSNYSYSISQNKITITAGVFSKNTLSVLFNLVGNVNVNEPFFLRFYDLAKIQFSTATDYIEIVLPKEDAASLQNLMTSQMSVNRVGVIS
jgi:uncharacterized membrane protein YdbT with pleckstrin-like domain